MLTPELVDNNHQDLVDIKEVVAMLNANPGKMIAFNGLTPNEATKVVKVFKEAGGFQVKTKAGTVADTRNVMVSLADPQLF